MGFAILKQQPRVATQRATRGQNVLRLANITNGLYFPHDDVCCFQSQHAHHRSLGYFRIDAMPYRAVIHLLRGGVVEIIDATRKSKLLSDALRHGVPTWCIVMNRAMKFDYQNIRVCEWQTPDMMKAARMHDTYLGTLRKLVRLYGRTKRPIQIGSQLLLRCYSNFEFDDKMTSAAAMKRRSPLRLIASHYP